MSKTLPSAPVRHRYVFELRYDAGYLYWDRAGRIAQVLLGNHEEWDVDSTDTRTCSLVNREKNLAFNYGPGKLDLSQTQNEDNPTLLSLEDFAKIADAFSKAVSDLIEPTYYSRMGFRIWTLYAASDRQRSQEQARQLGVASGIVDKATPLGQLEEVTCKFVVEMPDCMVRAAVAPFEQQVNLPKSVYTQARKQAWKESRGQRQARLDSLKAKRTIEAYPQFGLLTDLDAYVEDPPYPDNLGVSQFILQAEQRFEEVTERILEPR